MLSLCGVKCDECKDFNQSCNGCQAIAGKVYWAPYVNKTVCPIYHCCINEKQHEHCGQCKELPCQIYYDTQDPSVTLDEHEAGIKLRVNLLREK